MGPIDAEIVLFFQAAWLVLVAMLIRHILKLKDNIRELRSGLIPFAMLYENGEYKETQMFHQHIFQRAYRLITGFDK